MQPFGYIPLTPKRYAAFKSSLVNQLNVFFHDTELSLAHYSVRSYPQFLCKILSGFITIQINNHRGGMNDHWINRAKYNFSMQDIQ